MNCFEEILCQGESLIQNNYRENQDIFDKSTNQSNLISHVVQQIQSPFDSSPKASMFFFSLHSPRLNADNFQFNNQNSHLRKNSKDHIQPISRRLQFQEEQSLLCQQEELQYEQVQIKQEQQQNFSSSETLPKGKKIKKSKNSKGLKNLSIGVYQIVAERMHTTYKEVANTLIENLNKKAKEQRDPQTGYELLKRVKKDQHNIKRRVYDALNVLISAQLLRKQGKEVIFDRKSQPSQARKQKLKAEGQNFNSEINLQQMRIHQKRLQLQTLHKKFKKLEYLINKNRNTNINPSSRINLPFIVLRSNLTRTVSIGSRDVEILFEGKVLIMGDVDAIEVLQAHHI